VRHPLKISFSLAFRSAAQSAVESGGCFRVFHHRLSRASGGKRQWYASFLGAAYAHHGRVLVDTAVSRGEFLTSYTPYQAETRRNAHQIFEFQTMICQLTGMDVANASMADGLTATPEAAMMAVRATGRSSVLVSRTASEYRAYCERTRNQGMPVDEFGHDAATGLIDSTIWRARSPTIRAC
jgi:glycine dehydrogenase subunit 1